MQAAPARPFPRPRPERAENLAVPTLAEAGVNSDFINALPIAAGVFTLRDGGLRAEVVNRKFYDLAGCGGESSRFADKFRQYSAGPGGAFIRAFLSDPGGAPDEHDMVDGDGAIRRDYTLKLAPLTPGDDSEPRCLLSVVDRTPAVQAERSLRAEMLRDSLTGLPNRLAFSEAIERIGTTEEPGIQHAVLVVDVLRFSRINESLGALAGDELLMTFARRLIMALRGGDVLARTGGNEFGVLVTLQRGIEDALDAAERIQEVMQAPFRLSELEFRVECAIGVALMQDDQDGEQLFRHAQFAVKQAKLAGPPQVYEPRKATEARRRFSIETELRRAIEHDQLSLFYQPLVSLQTGKVTGFEALARWVHEDRGEISPTEFIPVAEESGLILSLGRWAMDQATRTLANWDREAGETLPLYIAVNLSALQVARDDVPAFVEAALRENRLDGSRLTLELTESAIVQDPERATRVFHGLKALDTTLAMDDFGTGYSSLAFLQRLPIDVLKIDKSFVSAMMSDPDSVAIVRAVLSLADALGMSTTAEGIESVELATTLAALGCESGQGFYFAEPLAAEKAVEVWRKRAHGPGLLNPR
ncbi:MAG: bifunctional diguanylate cyclase/phosphodiesterase [Sphingomicrobium sp.]